MTGTRSAARFGPAVLAQSGPARLTVDKTVVNVRRKGLAILYYLAVEGPTRRDHLAEILWGHGRARPNLRVELHRLKDTLAPYGIEPFASSGDPLALTGVVLERTIDSGTTASLGAAVDSTLDGLDDISPEFQEWLERRRNTTDHATGRHARTALVDELVRTIVPPYVLILAGEPGSGRRAVARDLAAQMGLPFVDGCAGSGAAVRYVVPDDSTCSDVATAIERDDACVWVLPRSLFGEDEAIVLRLRAVMPPDRLRFKTLEPLDWWSVKAMLPKDVTFPEGARLYLASGGNQQYLHELLELRTMGGPGAPLPVPLRMRAAFALEARKLSDGARHSLERASLHRGTLSRDVLSAVGASTHVEELERNGWLTYDGGGWRFASEVSRRMLEGLFREGSRHRIHDEIAVALEGLGAASEAAYHRSLSTGEPMRADSASEVDNRNRTPTIVHVGVGQERWLDDAATEGTSVRIDGDRVGFARTESSCPCSRARYRLEPEPLLLRVKGRAYVDAGASTSVGEQAATLVLSLLDSGARPVHLGGEGGAHIGPGEQLCLPLEQRFDYWLLAPAARELTLESCSTGAIIELRLAAYRPVAVSTESDSTCTVVAAYALDDVNDAGSVVDGTVGHTRKKGPAPVHIEARA